MLYALRVTYIFNGEAGTIAVPSVRVNTQPRDEK